jgi:hypothetical protein
MESVKDFIKENKTAVAVTGAAAAGLALRYHYVNFI